MTLKSAVLSLVLFSALGTAYAEQPNTLMVRIVPQVLEADQSVAWEQPLEKETQPGLPVVVNINAEGLAIRVTVTPFVRGRDLLLVVQGDVRQTKESSMRQSSSLQSVLVPPGEQIAYFPLGRSQEAVGRQMVVFIRVEFQGE